jgi:hypothetical protein
VFLLKRKYISNKANESHHQRGDAPGGQDQDEKIKMGLTVVYPRKMGENDQTKYSCRCFLPAASELRSHVASQWSSLQDMKIYTASDHWNIIPYVQCRYRCILLSHKSSNAELIKGGLQDGVVLMFS